jgi:hypothetical protein
MITIEFNDYVIVSKTRDQWIDELTEYHLDLAYDDGEFGNGLLDDFLRSGFKGYYNMTSKELSDEVVKHLDHLYEVQS